MLEKFGLGGFPQPIQNNILAILDYKGIGVIEFPIFVNTWSFLTHAKNVFLSNSQDGKCTDLALLLPYLSYKLDPSVINLLRVVVDREFKGYFDLNGFMSGVLFLMYSQTEFNDVDEQSTGSLTFEQVRDLLPNLGLFDASEEDARKLFDEIDLDKSGTLEYEEFIGLVIKLRFPQLVQKLQQ